jgi:hypothetical protein
MYSKRKKFISPVKNLTIFIQEINDDKFSGLLIQDDKDQFKPVTYIAEKGEFKKIENKSYLVLSKWIYANIKQRRMKKFLKYNLNSMN